MDKYTRSKKVGNSPFPLIVQTQQPFFVVFFTITTGIKGTVAYFAFTHLFFFLFLFIDFFQKHSIYGVAPYLAYSK